MLRTVKARLRSVTGGSKILASAYAGLSGIKADLLSVLPDSVYLRMKYRLSTGLTLELEHPRRFNEKLQWMKLYDHNPLYTEIVDKYRVRQYVAERIGEEHLIPLLGAWDSAEEINFDLLPDQFVLKCNHNSGKGMCICRKKSELNYEEARRELTKGLKENYYYKGREWPYKNVKRKIIGEKFLSGDGKAMDDYKVHCFSGEPRIILVCRDRFSKQGVSEDFFSPQWERLPLRRPGVRICDHEIARPEELEEMLRLSRVLSEGFPFLRTDFYIVDHRVYFGELTLFPGDGFGRFDPDEYDLILGDWLNLGEPTKQNDGTAADAAYSGNN